MKTNIKSNNVDELWNKVKEKFKHEYLRRLAILDHINELKVKHDKSLMDDSCPFEEEYFNKELADLFILLQFHYEFDGKFKEMYNKRKKRFIEKLESKY